MKKRDAIQALLAGLLASQGMAPMPALGQARIRRVVFVTGAPEKSFEDWMKGFRAANLT